MITMSNFFKKLFVLLALGALSTSWGYLQAQFTIFEPFNSGSTQRDLVMGGQAQLTSGNVDSVGQGWLRLTKTEQYKNGYVYIDESFPSTLGVHVEFEYKAWRESDFSKVFGGADGFSVFLFDASVPTFRIGGYAGSLGYANFNNGQGDVRPGLAGAYIGLGIDECGNFAAKKEGRNGGVPERVPNSITLRGSENSGWKYIKHVKLGADNFEDGPTSIDYNKLTNTRPDDNTFFRKVRIEIDPVGTETNPQYEITVSWQNALNGSWKTLLTHTTTEPLPDRLKIGFGASTGWEYNYHEIRNLFVTTPGGTSVTKTVDKATANVGDELTYTITVNNHTTGGVLNDLGFIDRFLDGNGDPLSTDDFEITSITFNNGGYASNTAKNYPHNVKVIPAEPDSSFVTRISMEANSTSTFTVTGRLKRMPPGGKVINGVYFIPPNIDKDITNNSAKVETDVILKSNYWYGGNGETLEEKENWADPENWTAKYVPNGKDDDVIFATVENWGSNAVNDLVLDQNRIIGNVTNESPVALRIPADKTLIIDKKADTGTAEKLIIEAEDQQPNGALIFSDISQNTAVPATVEFVSKSEPEVGTTWPRIWQFFGVPVKDKTLENLFGTNAYGSIYGYDPETSIIVRKYNEALAIPGNPQEKWDNMDKGTVMVPYYGYEITQPKYGMKHNLAGTLVTDESNTLNLTISDPKSGVYARGSFMLANPYAAPIQISKLEDADFVNLEKTVYIYNTGSRQQWIDKGGDINPADFPGTYTSVPVKASSTMGETQIPTLQAFLLRANEETPAPQFRFRYATVQHESLDVNTKPMHVKRMNATSSSNSVIKPMLTMDVIGKNSADRVYLITADGTSKHFDDGWDGEKVLTSGLAQLYAVTPEGHRMQVNTDKDLNNTNIGFRSGGESSYKLKFTFNEQMDGVYESLYLLDLATGEQHKVTDGAELTFSNVQGAKEKRFKLTSSRVPTDLGNAKAEESLTLAADSRSIILNNNSDQDAVLTVYDLVGNMLMNRRISIGLQTLEHNLSQGTYIIEARTVETGSKVVIKTIIGNR